MTRITKNGRLQQKTDLESNWEANDPDILKGEVCVSVIPNDQRKAKVKVATRDGKWSEFDYIGGEGGGESLWQNGLNQTGLSIKTSNSFVTKKFAAAIGDKIVVAAEHSLGIGYNVNSPVTLGLEFEPEDSDDNKYTYKVTSLTINGDLQEEFDFLDKLMSSTETDIYCTGSGGTYNCKLEKQSSEVYYLTSFDGDLIANDESTGDAYISAGIQNSDSSITCGNGNLLINSSDKSATFGANNIVSNSNSIGLFGSENILYSSDQSFVTGLKNKVYGATAAHAEGRETEAYGNYSHTEGEYTIARGEASHAGGKSTQATGDYSMAIGLSNVTGGLASFATGSSNTVSGESSSIIAGIGAKLSGDCSSVLTGGFDESGELTDNFTAYAKNLWTTDNLFVGSNENNRFNLASLAPFTYIIEDQNNLIDSNPLTNTAAVFALSTSNYNSAVTDQSDVSITRNDVGKDWFKYYSDPTAMTTTYWFAMFSKDIHKKDVVSNVLCLDEEGKVIKADFVVRDNQEVVVYLSDNSGANTTVIKKIIIS